MVLMNSRHAGVVKSPQLYETPAVATEALLRAEQLPDRLWEPAAGRGAMVRVLRAAGHRVLSTDLHDFRSADVDQVGVNFLRPQRGVPKVGAVVTNPPFSHAQEFVNMAMLYTPMCCMLLRLSFLESESRHRWFQEAGLDRVHIFSNRLPMMHRDGWKGKKASSNVCHAWFVFRRGYRDAPKINWIMWRESC